MKNLLLCMLLGTFLISCSSQNATTDSTTKKSKERDYSMFSTLADVLRAQGGLNVRGIHPNITIDMRGQGSIMLETQPLYIVDDVVIGNDYAMASNAINPSNIKSIQIIKDASRLTRYGSQANHGAIIIKTKSGSQLRN